MYTRKDKVVTGLSVVVFFLAALLLPYGEPLLRGAAGLTCSLVVVGTYVLFVRKSDDQISVEAALENAAKIAESVVRTSRKMHNESTDILTDVAEAIGHIVIKSLKFINSQEIGWRVISVEAHDTERYALRVRKLMGMLTGEIPLPRSKEQQAYYQILNQELPDVLKSLYGLEEAIDKAIGGEKELAETDAELEVLNEIYQKADKASQILDSLNTIFSKDKEITR